MINKVKKICTIKNVRCDCIDGKEIIEKEWFKYKKQKAILIDVRSEQEFKEGHIKDAISIPYYEIKRRIADEIKDKNKMILVYCNTGSRSKKAEDILKQLRYTNVKTLFNK